MYKSLELFCGTGGLALGLHQSGFIPVALIERDADSCNNIIQNINQGNRTVNNWTIINDDIRNIDYSQFDSEVDVITGGPPCQPFSIGGKSMANDDERDMFPEAVRAIREIRPKAFILENVKGLLRESFKPYYEYIIAQLSNPSVVKKADQDWESHCDYLKRMSSDCDMYNVRYQLFNAADYGIPQIRNRVFIVGIRKDLGRTWIPPIPTHSKESLLYEQYVTGDYWIKHDLRIPEQMISRDINQRANSKKFELKPWNTVRDAIGDLPDPKNNNNIPNHEYRAGAKSYKGHTSSIMDLPSKTIKAGAHGVPGGENTILLDDGTTRYYTVRESARIQTFPDDYFFYSSWTESMRQIGNAVPVKLAKIIGDSVYEQLKKCD